MREGKGGRLVGMEQRHARCGKSRITPPPSAGLACGSVAAGSQDGVWWLVACAGHVAVFVRCAGGYDGQEEGSRCGDRGERGSEEEGWTQRVEGLR